MITPTKIQILVVLLVFPSYMLNNVSALHGLLLPSKPLPIDCILQNVDFE